MFNDICRCAAIYCKVGNLRVVVHALINVKITGFSLQFTLRLAKINFLYNPRNFDFSNLFTNANLHKNMPLVLCCPITHKLVRPH